MWLTVCSMCLWTILNIVGFSYGRACLLAIVLSHNAFEVLNIATFCSLNTHIWGKGQGVGTPCSMGKCAFCGWMGAGHFGSRARNAWRSIGSCWLWKLCMQVKEMLGVELRISSWPMCMCGARWIPGGHTVLCTSNFAAALRWMPAWRFC